MRKLINEFEKRHPYIKVNLQQLTWEYGLDKFIISLAAGNAPDICELGTTWIAKFASSGVLLDITAETEDIRDEYFLWEAATYNNRVYGVPWLAGTRVLFYNKDLFREAGLDPEGPPQTWEELLAAAKKIHNPEQGRWGFSIYVGEPESPWQEFLPLAWSYGSKILSEDGGKSLLNSGETLKALEFYKELSGYSLIERQSQINELFAEGKVGAQISGSWNLRLIPYINPQLNYGTGYVPAAGFKDREGTAFSGGELFVITRESKHPKEALKLIQFLTSRENVMEIVRVQQNVVPAQRKALHDPFYDEHPEQKVFVTQLKNAASPPNHPRWPQIQECITTMIEKTIMKNVEPKDILESASLKIDRILKEETRGGGINSITINSVIAAVIFAFAVCLLVLFKGRLKTFLYLGPWLLVFVAFGAYPLIYSVIISFSKYDLLGSQFTFVGLKNYTSILLDRGFIRALWHTFVFCLGTVPFTTGLALLCAVLINRKIPFRQFYQTGLFLPVTTSVVVLATVFTYIYSPKGLANQILDFLGIIHPESSWLNSPRSWFDISVPLLSIMAMNIWASFGYYTILFLAGLQTIPESLYEVASLDGATEWQKFRHITLPQLKPIILLVVVINTIYSLQVFPEIFTMTMGGPLGSTTTAVYHIYELGFHRFEMGLASSAAYILSVIIMIFSLIQMKLINIEGELEE
ncbi:MAG: extracellular solute-binding protein [Candidatus Omnitrophica bacterium]|nr:extracellular solute-binding protein [Candidatus Omnitrophota bacterium]